MISCPVSHLHINVCAFLVKLTCRRAPLSRSEHLHFGVSIKSVVLVGVSSFLVWLWHEFVVILQDSKETLRPVSASGVAPGVWASTCCMVNCMRAARHMSICNIKLNII